MAWNCPDCGKENKPEEDCSCGYSFVKILGIKHGSSLEDGKKAYKYLINVWEKDSSSLDAIAKKKAEDRVAKIKQAFEIFRTQQPGAPQAEYKPPVRLLIPIVGGIIVLAVLAFFVFPKSNTEAPRESVPPVQTPVAQPGQQETARETPTAAPVQPLPQQPPPPALPQAAKEGMTEEEAIDVVKKSEALLKKTSVDEIIKKWTEDNAGKLQLVGWRAKKMEDQRYLVSYTAMDGAVPKGFYFDVEIATGKVENLANKPELQKKYNIHYNQ